VKITGFIMSTSGPRGHPPSLTYLGALLECANRPPRQIISRHDVARDEAVFVARSV